MENRSPCFLEIGIRIDPKYKTLKEGAEFKIQYKIGHEWTDAQARIIVPKHRIKDFLKYIKEKYGH